MYNEARYFVNDLIDYDPNMPGHVIDVNTKELVTKEWVIPRALALLNFLEIKLNTDIDVRDNTIYTGCAGYALFYHSLTKASHLFSSEQRKDYLNKAHSYATTALQKLSRRDLTFLCGDTGPLAVSALVANERGNNEEAKSFVKYILALLPSVLDAAGDLPNEMLYGRAGYLYSLLLIKTHITTTLITDEILRNVINVIIESGRNTAREEYGNKRNTNTSPPLVYYWHGKGYVGAAHGYVGILYQLLQCKWLLTDEELNSLIKPTIDYLLTIRYSSGNMPSSIGSSTDQLVHWCHGAPGVVSLLTKAYEIYGDQKYINAAIESCEVIWTRGLLTKGYGLCHGTAGNAYAFVSLFKATRDEKHLHRAVKLAEWCCDYGKHGTQNADRPWSLFEGLAGTIYFLFDVIKPDTSHFPAYELSL